MGGGKCVSEQKEAASFKKGASYLRFTLVLLSVFFHACKSQHGKTPALGNQVALETGSPWFHLVNLLGILKLLFMCQPLWTGHGL